MIKGTTTIELFDTQGNKTQSYKKDNFATDLIAKAIEYGVGDFIVPANSYWDPDSTINQRLSNRTVPIIASHINLLSTYGGLLIFKDELRGDASSTIAPTMPFAVAGGNYANTIADRGSLNTVETVDLYNSNSKVIGKRFVWDFLTHQANGTFRSLALTDINSGNQYYRLNSCVNLNMTTEAGNCFYPSYGLYNTNTWYTSIPSDNVTKYALTRIGKNLNFFRPLLDATGYERTYKDSVAIPGNSNFIENINTRTVTFEGYTGCYYLHCIEDYVYTIMINTNTNKQTLLKISQDTDTIIETTELNIEGDVVIKMFSICGNKLIYGDIHPKTKATWTRLKTDAVPSYIKNVTKAYIYSPYYYFISMNTYNLTDKTVDPDPLYIPMINASTDSYVYITSKLLMFKDGNGEFTSYFSNATYIRNNATEIYIHSDSFAYNSFCQPFNGLPIGIGLVYQSGSGCTVTSLYHTLLTINNLEAPITKTEANTMKITYEVRWGE